MSGPEANGLSPDSEIVVVESGHSEVSRVKLDLETKSQLGLSYGTYITVTLSREDDHPTLTFEIDPESRTSSNTLKMTSTDMFPLPNYLVRSFGIRDGIEWESISREQVVGNPTGYNNGSTLLHVAQYYLSEEMEESILNTSETGPPFTTFSDLASIASQVQFQSEDSLYPIAKSDRGFNHLLPDDFGLSEGDEFLYVVFDDGYSFVIGLLPVPSESEGGDEFSKKERLVNAWRANPDADPEDVADATDSSYSYASTIRRDLYWGEKTEDSTNLEEYYNESLYEKYNRGLKQEPSVDEYSKKYNPMKGAPEQTLAEEYDSVHAPTDSLDYENDRVSVKQNKNGDFVYTVPKQVADALGIDGATSEWIRVEDALFSRLVGI